MTPPTIAIVCTVRNPSPSFTTWIHHHSQLVDRLYICLDGPTEVASTPIKTDPAISIFIGAHKSEFSGPSGVMQRQCKNVMHALTQCVDDGIDWLIHIDSDELIYSPEQSLKSYFSQIDLAISCVRFINHEVVNTYTAEDPFKELKVFKKNQLFVMAEEESQVMEYPFFFGYMNGKSAVRVEQCIGPSGVHAFEVRNGEVVLEQEICILHYLSATYNDWLKKCAELGEFNSFWFDDLQQPMYKSFLVASRDIYLHARQSGNWIAASDFYSQFLIAEPEIKNLLEKGKLLHFNVFNGD